ncbi:MULTISPECIES: two-component system sensor histidine kinase SapS [Enterococcus]|uniref:histidine kinase n=1 Tax=Enterococcus sulfureus ATCC 49903 TaxID=1140003 RepID=S0KY22_9ENTE|nr:sensor histidine kinase [Enterococcus sulfureus]EOT49507.1 two-component system sensor histidine kinase [Enterococcus sulfureus ATCC 49903]EOT87374.1 two-component system sensor histidine kinase [Enterococcus sulfureus ATCC 49903]
MTIRNYIKDQWLTYLGWIVFFMLTVFVIWLTPNYPFEWSIAGYLFVIEFIGLVGIQSIHYVLKRSWWRKLAVSEDYSVLQNYLTGARSSVEKLQQQYVNQAIQEHQAMMQEVISAQEEQKEYIDSWVHEIKLPLAASQLLLRSIEFDIPDDKYIALENELTRMNDYVEQVLYVARLESFTKDYLIQESSLKETIQPVIRSQANYFIQKNIRFSLIGEDEVVLTDPKWVAFIYRQIVSNAIKYTDDAGVVMTRIEKQKRGVMLHIVDTGIGIPPEDLKRIFDKGFTGTNGRNAQIHSTGLGLYLAKNLAQKLGIELTVQSQWKEGTTVSLFFPKLSYYNEYEEDE